MSRKIRVSQRFMSGSLRPFSIKSEITNATNLAAEIADMRDVLMGRVPPQVHGVLALMETAEAFFARACEMEQEILRREREGDISNGMQGLKKFRTGELRSFKELAKSATELGSRRVTAESLRVQQEMKGRESGS